MNQTYYKDPQGNLWVLIINNDSSVLAKVTEMDPIILTKEKHIKFRRRTLEKVKETPDMPHVAATVFTTDNGRKYVQTTINKKTISFVMDAEQNVLKAINNQEFADVYEKCEMARCKPENIALTNVILAVFKRKEYMMNVCAA